MIVVTSGHSAVDGERGGQRNRIRLHEGESISMEVQGSKSVTIRKRNGRIRLVIALEQSPEL